MLATGPGVYMTGGHGSFFKEEEAADSPWEMIKRVRELVRHKVDVIKIVSADGPETLGEWWTVQTTREEAEACFGEARRLGRQTASHAMGAEGIENVVLAGVDTVEHGWYMNEESCRLMPSTARRSSARSRTSSRSSTTAPRSSCRGPT